MTDEQQELLQQAQDSLNATKWLIEYLDADPSQLEVW